MKVIKLMVCTFSLLLTGVVYASHTRYGVAANRVDSYEQVVRNVFNGMSQAEQKVVSQLHEWAQKGDVPAFYEFIEQTRTLQYKNLKDCPGGTVLTAGAAGGVCIHPEVLLKADGFKNNLLHNAKNKETLQTVSILFAEFFPQGWVEFNNLKDEKNVAGETPLIAHISRGDLNSFLPLYEGSSLQKAAAKINEISANPNPLVQGTLEIYKQDFLQRGGENAGKETLVSLVERTQDGYLKRDILSFCQKEMSFLF